jgi:hypothetical protein
VVATVVSRLTRLSNCNTATRRVIVGFLGLFQPQKVIPLLRFRNVRSAHFIGFVAVLRLESPVLWQIALKGVLKLHQVITFGRPIADANRARHDLERLEQTGQTGLRERLASLPLRPRAALDCDQGLDQLAGRQTVNVAFQEDGIDVGQQLDPNRVVLDYGPGCLKHAPRPLRPLAADGLGNCEQTAPIIGDPVEDAGRHRRISRAQAIEIICGPARRLAGELVKMPGPVKSKWFYWLAIETSLQLNGDRAIGQRARELADQGDCTRRIGCELPRLEILVRKTEPPRRWPELRIPRSSSFSPRNVSASSMSNVGR